MCFVIEKGQENPYIASRDIKCCSHPQDVVVRCTIPKGTLFFKSKLEYVSNGIKVENVT